jgi:hypothetical protein
MYSPLRKAYPEGMSMYFFHILYGDTRVPDEEGMYLGGPSAAQAEAASGAKDLTEVARRCGDLTPSFIEIMDEDDFVVGFAKVTTHPLTHCKDFA